MNFVKSIEFLQTGVTVFTKCLLLFTAAEQSYHQQNKEGINVKNLTTKKVDIANETGAFFK